MTYEVLKKDEETGATTQVAANIEAGDADAAIETVIEQAPNRMLAEGTYVVREYTETTYRLTEERKMVIARVEETQPAA